MEINELKNINVKCTSGNSLNYNWFKNGVSLGKTLSSLDIVGTSAGNFTYSVTISNTAGTVTLTQNLTINSPQVAPSSCYILASPIGQSMNTNESKKLTVTCSNGTDLKYTWTKNGTAYSNGSNSIQISNLAAGNYEFNANISNSIGSVSNTFTINVNAIQSIARCTQASNILSASLKNYSGIYNQTFSETVPSGSIESFPFTISKSIYPAGIKFSLEAGFNEGAYNSTDVSISECPGAFTGLPTGCAMINRASPNISATYIKLAGISCVIQEGKTYYLNIRPSAGSPSAAPVISPQQF